MFNPGPLTQFYRKTFVVLRGAFAAQAIGLVLFPVLTRMYSPAEFGIFQAFQLVISIGLVAAALRYEIPILTANTRAAAQATTTLSLFLNVVTATVILFFCLAVAVFPLDGFVGLHSILLITPLWFLSAGLQQTFFYTALREQAFHDSAIARVLQALIYASVAILLGFTGLMAFGLVLADMLSRAIAAGFLLVRCGRNYILPFRTKNIRRMRLAAWTSRSYPFVSLPSALINAGGGMIVPLLVLATFDAETAGQYALVDRTIGAAVGVLGQSVSQVFMSSFSESLRGEIGHSQRLFRRIVLVQFAIGLVPTLLAPFILPTLFSIVFGENWRLAGEFAAIMSPLIFLVGFATTPVNMALLLMGKQRWQLAWDTFRLAGVAIIWVLASWINLSPLNAVGLHVGFSCVAYLLYLWSVDWSLRLLRRAGDPKAVKPEMAI